MKIFFFTSSAFLKSLSIYSIQGPEVDRASNEGVGACGGGTHQAKS